MTSPAGELVAPPTWGAARARRREPLRAGAAPAGGAVRFGIRSSPVSDAAGAALVLGGSAALWAAFLLAVS